MLGWLSHAKTANIRFAAITERLPMASDRTTPSRATRAPPTNVPRIDQNTPKPFATAAICFRVKPMSR